ncbi:transcription elongation factor GreAB [Pontiella sp.]|uniref:transcription elongation factor GreAB n=1 Tax=Pontiella sp. TaxID=2837462 RepID=UPI00356A4225
MKQAILNAVIQALEHELALRQNANAQSNAGAAFSAANAEKQRDTTGYEAAHLARGHALFAKNLRCRLDELKALAVEDFTGQEIDVGALVEVEMGGEVDRYLLLNCGGGIEVTVDGKTVTVITPESPLGSALMGNIEAGFITLPSGAEGIILDVY